MWKLIAAFALIVIVTFEHGQDKVLEAAQFWERMIEAKGGRERLLRVNSLAVSILKQPASSTDSTPADNIRYELVAMFPGRLWAWDDNRPGQMGFGVEVWNQKAKARWESRNGAPGLPSPWTEAGEQGLVDRLSEIQAYYLLETRYFRPTPKRLVRDSPAPGKAVLEATAPGFASLLFTVSLDTYLPTSLVVRPIVTPMGGGQPFPARYTTEYQFERYMTIDGIVMPTRVKALGDLSFIINPDIDPKLFETAPDGVTSATTWRRFLRSKLER